MYHYKVIKDETLRKVLVVLPGFFKDDLKFFLRRRAYNSYLVCECRKNETVKEIYGDLFSEIEILELNLGFMDNPEVDSYKYENGILEVRIYDQPKKYDFNVTEEAMNSDYDSEPKDDYDYREDYENFDCYINGDYDSDFDDSDHKWNWNPDDFEDESVKEFYEEHDRYNDDSE